MDDLSEWLASEFAEVLADKSIKAQADRIRALIGVVDRLHSGVAGLDMRNTHAGIERETRNGGDVTLHIDAHGDIAAIEIPEGDRIADLRFWLP